MKPLLFEHVRCSRCGGSGQMPFSVYNGRCFKCNGNGSVLTRRGFAAQTYLNQLRMRTVDQLKVGDLGDLLLHEGFAAGSYSQPSIWGRITKIEFGIGSDFGYLGQDADKPAHRITTTHGALIGFAGSLYRKGFTREEKAAQRAEALAYQATLTKNGTPRKEKK